MRSHFFFFKFYSVSHLVGRRKMYLGIVQRQLILRTLEHALTATEEKRRAEKFGHCWNKSH